MRIVDRPLLMLLLLLGLAGLFGGPPAAQAATVTIKLNGTQVFTTSCTGAGCAATIGPRTLRAGTDTRTVIFANNSTSDVARVQTTAGSSTFFAKVTGAQITASSASGATGAIAGGTTLEISVTGTAGDFGTNITGGTKAYTCSLNGFWNRSILPTLDNVVTQVCSAENNAGSLVSVNSILNFVTLSTSATSFSPSSPAQETLSQACGTTGAANCTPEMTVVFTVKFTKYGDKVTLPNSGDSGGSVANVEDEGLLDLNIAQNIAGFVTWPLIPTVRVNFTKPDHDRPNPPGPNIPVKVEKSQACSTFAPADRPPACGTPSVGDQYFMMVSDLSNNGLFDEPGGANLHWVRSDDRSFVGTPFNGKVSDITVLKANGTFQSLPEAAGSLYFSLKGPGKQELIRIHLGAASTPTQQYGTGPTAIAPCGSNVIGLSEARYEIVETGELVTWNGLGNLKSERLESVSLVLAVPDSTPTTAQRQSFKMTCVELDTRTTVLQLIPHQNDRFVPSCNIESQPGRAKVFVTRDTDPTFFELVDMSASTCRWDGAVTISSGQAGTYLFQFILDDQPRPDAMDIIFAGQ